MQQKVRLSNNIEEGNVSCQLFTNLEFSEEDIPLEYMDDTTFQEVHTVVEVRVDHKIKWIRTPAKIFLRCTVIATYT